MGEVKELLGGFGIAIWNERAMAACRFIVPSWCMKTDLQYRMQDVRNVTC